MRIVRALIVAAAMLLAGAGGALAQPPAAQPSPESLQAAKELVALISRQAIADMTANVTAKVWPQVQAALQGQYPKIDAATLAELRAAYERLVGETVRDAMVEAPALYARYFTAAEMREIAAFYRGPTGSKALAVMPKVTGDLVPILVPRMQAMQAKLGASFEAILKRHGLETK